MKYIFFIYISVMKLNKWLLQQCSPKQTHTLSCYFSFYWLYKGLEIKIIGSYKKHWINLSKHRKKMVYQNYFGV